MNSYQHHYYYLLLSVSGSRCQTLFDFVAPLPSWGICAFLSCLGFICFTEHSMHWVTGQCLLQKIQHKVTMATWTVDDVISYVVVLRMESLCNSQIWGDNSQSIYNGVNPECCVLVTRTLPGVWFVLWACKPNMEPHFKTIKSTLLWTAHKLYKKMSRFPIPKTLSHYAMALSHKVQD